MFMVSHQDSSTLTGIACWQTAGLVIKEFRVRPPAGTAGEFSSPELTFCAGSYSVVSVPHCVTAVTHERSRSFYKSAGGVLHLKTLTPLTKRSWSGLTMLSIHSVGTYQGNEVTRNSLGYRCPQSSQLAEPLWTDPGVKCGISMLELIST